MSCADKEVVMFQATSSVGTMFSGYLQAAVHAGEFDYVDIKASTDQAGLDGTSGLRGWQWLMIMDGVICLPIAFAGFFLIPDSPTNVNPRAKWVFKPKDIDMAIARSQKWKRAPRKGLTVKAFKETFSAWIPVPFRGI